jgi:hypothetical protein
VSAWQFLWSKFGGLKVCCLFVFRVYLNFWALFVFEGNIFLKVFVFEFAPLIVRFCFCLWMSILFFVKVYLDFWSLFVFEVCLYLFEVCLSFWSPIYPSSKEVWIMWLKSFEGPSRTMEHGRVVCSRTNLNKKN